MLNNRHMIGNARIIVRLLALVALIGLTTAQEECSNSCIAQSAIAVGCGAPNYDPVGSEHCICLVCQDAYFPSLEACLRSTCPDYAQYILDQQSETCSSYREGVLSTGESTWSNWNPSETPPPDLPWWSTEPVVVPVTTTSTDPEQSAPLTNPSDTAKDPSSISSTPYVTHSSSSHTSRRFSTVITVGQEGLGEATVANTGGSGEDEEGNDDDNENQFSKPQHPMIIIGTIFTILFIILLLIGIGYALVRYKRRREAMQEQDTEAQERLMTAATPPEQTPPVSMGYTGTRPIRHAAEIMEQHSPTVSSPHLQVPSNLTYREWEPKTTHAPPIRASHTFLSSASEYTLLTGPRPS